MMNLKVREILSEWKKEAGITHFILFKLRAGDLIIYTDRPGPLIGCRGERVDRYKERLLALPHGWVKSISIVETNGIV